MGKVRDCLGHRLEHEEESEDVLVIRCIRCIHLILAFQTWVTFGKYLENYTRE